MSRAVVVIWHWALLWLLVGVPSVRSTAAEKERPPNIVLMLADNLGYQDISWFADGHNNRTPHIDSLGATGLQFTNWNSAAHLCSASRSALLTGQYPARSGVYPGVFHPDAASGLPPNTTRAIASYLKQAGYATSMVGKWHLGHRPDYLPHHHGFDEWLGIPYHMSGGSLDNHTCLYDIHGFQWLPLYRNERIIQQPVRLEELAATYAQAATDFIETHVDKQPFFLYMAFSHVHQLCASADVSEPEACQWNAYGDGASFADALQEMDWIAGQILQALDRSNQADRTLVVFTSDNGPWVAEQSCSGLKGPFQGQWLRDHVHGSCTACPHDYVSNPTPDHPRRCTAKTPISLDTDNTNKVLSVNGVHCGEDTGLGSVWEANLRMPSLVRWPGNIAAHSQTDALVSSLDLVPTILSIVGIENETVVDGIDISPVLFGESYDSGNRVLFFWRDGFLLDESPLGPPYGRFDVVAIKVGNIKGHYWTKSAHYNPDIEQFHDPPLLFDTISDPAEAYPIQYDQDDDDSYYVKLTKRMALLVDEHKKSIPDMYPLALTRDPRYIPCVDPATGCRTHPAGSLDKDVAVLQR